MVQRKVADESPWEAHKRTWNSCRLCELCIKRKHVVHLRGGKIPAPVLFVGEAPGESENALGRPFIGPAGKLLDTIIERAGLIPGQYLMTNLIGCIPYDETGRKISEPPEFAIRACQEKLAEIIGLAKPKLVVAVGDYAKKWLPRLSRDYAWERPVGDGIQGIHDIIPMVSITHPGAIIRANISQRGLAVQTAIVTLADAVEELGL